jgi:hypothetical protein
MADGAPEFLAAARAFRAALVSDDIDRGEFARQVRNALARVYLAAALLGPPTAVETDDDPPEARPAPAESRTLWSTLSARFGEHDHYVDVFDPSLFTDDDAKAMSGSITQDLVEIDEDLAESIAWLERDIPGVLWDVRFAFENHWGRHALSCLRPLHQLAVYGVV